MAQTPETPLTDPTILETYIVHVNSLEARVFSSDPKEIENWHQSFLPSSSRLVYSYRKVITGFAARLSPEEAKAMEKIDGFMSAQPQRLLSLHTTHSPGFMGLNLRQNSGAWVGSNYGKGVIIGRLDTGVNPNHPSFNDKGAPPPPEKWKGKCEFKRTACNKKLIGARNFIPESTVGPFDDLGHGTHTASTAAGNFVRNASVFGQANGTAAGMAPHAHLAIYKVCTRFGCFESDVLAGMDAAVEDGVDILSLSLGGSSIPFREDNIAKGAFGAMQKGIFVTVQRPTNFSSTLLPLVCAGTSNPTLAFCDPLLLIDVNLKGKVVLCEAGGDIENVEKGQAVKDAGGVAMIIMNQERDGFTILAEAHVLSNTRDKLAPMVSSFSSRGPSLASPGILKPDVIGPGVNILAAWPISIENKTNSRLTFNMVSCTSMSCPHLSGIAALLKSAHPIWSPAAIKSAIMTTTDRANHLGKPIIDETLFPADIFAIGSGHVNPSRAINPGLVYDLKPNDYIPYLCGLNYTDQDIYFITKHTVKCSKVSKIPEAQLNYPSFSITLGSGHQTYTRTVTNVVEANSSYDSVIVAPPGVNVTLNTTRLEFSEVNRKITYQVTFSRVATGGDASFVHGILSWTSSNSIQFVRSPISVKLVRGK
ncbi:hypothetical protein ACSBR2_041017 [Camellia fascicularis]